MKQEAHNPAVCSNYCCGNARRYEGPSRAEVSQYSAWEQDIAAMMPAQA